MAITDPTQEEVQEPQGPEEADPMAGVGALIETLGNCIRQNADKSAGTEGDAEAAKNFAQAALYAAQALAALVPYEDPSAANPKGDNPAKRGD